MKPRPPPCVSKTNPDYVAWRYAVWQKTHRTHLNKYNMAAYYAKKKGQYQNGTPHTQVSVKSCDALESDRKYREEMRLKGCDNF